MHVFKDTNGRDWCIEINVSAVKRVRAMLSIDLYGLVDDKLAGLSKLTGDVVSFVDVVYVLCREQAEKRGVSDEDFGRAMAGDAIDLALDAFLKELVDFFPDPRKRAALTKVLSAGKTLQAKILDRVESELEAFDADAVLATLMPSATVSPASSVSTPDPLPSDDSTSWLRPDNATSGTAGR